MSIKMIPLIVKVNPRNLEEVDIAVYSIAAGDDIQAIRDHVPNHQVFQVIGELSLQLISLVSGKRDDTLPKTADIKSAADKGAEFHEDLEDELNQTPEVNEPLGDTVGPEDIKIPQKDSKPQQKVNITQPIKSPSKSPGKQGF